MLKSEQYLQDPSTQTTSTATDIVEIEEKAEENWRPLVIKTDEPTNEQLDEALVEISAVSPEIKPNPTVRKCLIYYWANLPAALERLKKAVNENWRCNLTGVFVNALKEPPEHLPPLPPAKEYRYPTLEQLSELGALGTLIHTTLDEPGYPKVLAVDTGSGVLPWWQALNHHAPPERSFHRSCDAGAETDSCSGDRVLDDN